MRVLTSPRRARPLLAGGAAGASPRVVSWTLATIVDAGLVLGAATLLCGLAGIGDDNADAAAFSGIGAGCTIIAATARRRLTPPERADPGRVFAGIAALWTVLVAFGAAVYIGTGALGRVDDAVVESAAGFTTTALTLLDAAEASRTVLLWRAASSWVGGFMAVLITVVALPSVLRSTALISYSTGRRGLDLAPSASVGARRALAVYSSFTAACVAAYLLVGLGPVDALVVGLGTASTGGFTGRSDSLASYGVGAQAVAGVGMFLAGAGIFVLWWIARGRLQSLWRSQELRAFTVLVAAATAALAANRGVGLGEAAFTAVSIMSTTGFAVADWTGWGASASAVLLVGAGIGSMMGSPGGGLRVMRAHLLMGSVGGGLRGELDPYAVVLVRRDGETLTPRTLDRLGGHQIAYVALVGVGAMLLGASGLSLSDSVWGSVSAVATLGPSVGEAGAFGLLGEMDPSQRLALVPLLVGGRMSILPLLAGVGLGLSIYRAAVRRARYAAGSASGRLAERARRER